MIPLVSISIPNPAGEIDFAWVGRISAIENSFLLNAHIIRQGMKWSLTDILLIIYLSGVIIVIFRLIKKIYAIIFMIRKSNLIPSYPIILAVHPDFQYSSFFKYVLLPRYEENDPELNQIILHESVHARGYHSADLLVLQVIKALFWFNPLIYLFELSMKEVHEFQADEAVIQKYSPV
jgi:beta-lactamase regulating signal transducer with metallopeptidase domain